MLAWCPAFAEPLRLGVVVDGGRRVFSDAMRTGIEQAAHELAKPETPIEIVWREPEKPGDRAEQARLVDDLTRARVSAILLSPIDRQVLRLPVEAAVRAGVPVVVLDSGVDGDAPASVVASDNRAAGREAARLVGRLLAGRGGVLLLRHQIHAAKAEEREEGFIGTLTREFPELNLIASDYHAGPTVEAATRVAVTLLQRHAGKIAAVFASSETGTAGMLATLRRAPLAGGPITLVGSDEGGGLLQAALRAGDVQGFIAEDPVAMGRAAAKTAIARVRGAPFDPAVAVDFAVVTAAGRVVHSLAREKWSVALRAPFECPACSSPDTSTPAAHAAGLPQGDFVIPGLGLAMIAVGPGTFSLSTIEPSVRTTVTLTRPFWLGKNEVTQREWTEVMGANPSDFRGDGLPVDQVAWADAMEFCRRLTERERAAGRLPPGHAYRLPTEAQWEYAARAGSAPVADPVAMLTFAWCATTSGATQPHSGVWRMSPHPVGTRRANAWGFHDLSGNVAEWCLDWHGELPSTSVTDPRGPDRGTYRVLRGGSWWADVQNCRVDSRHRAPPARHHNALGLRVALSAVSP